VIPFEALREEVERRRRERWVRILKGERPGRAAGRRPRDPAKEDLFIRLDRRQLELMETERELRLSREGEPPEG
jgi:hypothetical protein